jgi:Flp pilus assembly protein TadD
MSLLLDALKKAAQEKQNADSAGKDAEADNGLSSRSEPDAPSYPVQPDSADPAAEVEQELELELELDDEEPELEIELDATGPEQEPEFSDHEQISPAYEQAPASNFNGYRATPTPSTVSDEALSLLITKTNEENKKNRLRLWGGVFVGAIILLSLSGMYFYADMVEEIESMRRKHEIALATLKSKTRIEENLTSLAVAPGQDEQPETSTENIKPSPSETRQSSRDVKNLPERENFTVQRANKKDPVSENLQRGWAAFQKQDYETSRLEYQKVLNDEPGNHDALLGMAAVSLQQQDVDTARDLYIKLLELDPRDPHAHAGLASIAQTSGASLSETKLKQLIEFRPDDAHLQFALGNLYVQKKKWPDAQQAFFNAWKADNKNPDYAYNLAVSLDQLGKHQQASTYYADSLMLATGKNISFSPEAVKNRLAYLGSLQ